MPEFQMLATHLIYVARRTDYHFVPDVTALIIFTALQDVNPS